jgi:hypothetical protein
VCDLDSPGTRFHDGQMATSVTGLIERFYGELWNKWNDNAVDDTLSPDFTFRGSLGPEPRDGKAGGSTATWCALDRLTSATR